MALFHHILIVLSAYATLSSAFWWSSGTTEQPKQPQYYHQRVLQGNPGYVEAPPPVPVVPLKAQLSPSASVHNVQLIPCLCPVSPDYDGPQDGIYYPQNPQHKGK